nr:unnamed protein product [Digitaria exilis]
MGSSKLAAGALFLAVALLVATALPPSAATSRGEPTTSSPAPAPGPGAPQPAATSCMPWFMGMTPCMDFFTDADVKAPSGSCCKGLQALVDGEPICLCHAMNGDIDNLMPASTDFSRVADLPSTCGVALPVEALSECESESGASAAIAAS